MNLLDYTSPTCLLPHLVCGDREEAVVRLVETLAAAGEVRRADALVAEILRREREASTAIGDGLWIPHARSEQVRRLRFAACSLADPLVIPSPDERPIDLVILIAGPPEDKRPMLRVLARLARLVKRGSFLDQLRDARTPAGMSDVLRSSGGDVAGA